MDFEGSESKACGFMTIRIIPTNRSPPSDQIGLEIRGFDHEFWIRSGILEQNHDRPSPRLLRIFGLDHEGVVRSVGIILIGFKFNIPSGIRNVGQTHEYEEPVEVPELRRIHLKASEFLLARGSGSVGVFTMSSSREGEEYHVSGPDQDD